MTEPRKLSSITPAKDGVHLGLRIHSGDYGNGTVVADLGAMGIQVYWDTEILGTRDHLLTHDRSYIDRMERL